MSYLLKAYSCKWKYSVICTFYITPGNIAYQIDFLLSPANENRRFCRTSKHKVYSSKLVIILNLSYTPRLRNNDNSEFYVKLLMIVLLKYF